MTWARLRAYMHEFPTAQAHNNQQNKQADQSSLASDKSSISLLLRHMPAVRGLGVWLIVPTRVMRVAASVGALSVHAGNVRRRYMSRLLTLLRLVDGSRGYRMRGICVDIGHGRRVPVDTRILAALVPNTNLAQHNPPVVHVRLGCRVSVSGRRELR